jgi:dTDP-4-amino-4,6-dideoxygalactose transaminase
MDNILNNTYRVPFLDLSVRDATFKNELLQAVDRVLTHGRILLGPEVEQFETRIAELSQRKYAVGVNSGTDALYFALRALEIGTGDEVITTSLSWIATANAVTLCGARPVFVDVTEDLTINAELIEAAITPRTKAILPVHFTGRLCDITRIAQIADDHGLYLIEDAAPSFGASYNGSKAGSFGHLGAFSMNPMKLLNAYGEAGAVVTDDEELRDRLVSLRYAGTINKEDCHFPSPNGRIDTIQAAMMLVGLGRLDDKVSRRRAIASFYDEALGEAVNCPKEPEGYFNVYYTYTIIAERRDVLKQHLEAKGIETKVQHPILMPYHTAYKNLPKPNIPVAEDLVKRILCIPAHEDLGMDEAEYVAASIREFYGA